MTIFKTEFCRIFRNGFMLLLIFFFLIASLYYTNSGVSQYQERLENKETFLNIEQIQARKAYTYEIYGGLGFRLFVEPSPLVVFFQSSSVVENTESNLNTLENYKMFNSPVPIFGPTPSEKYDHQLHMVGEREKYLKKATQALDFFLTTA